MVVVNGAEYFHLKDLEDGDFVGIDRKKNVFLITHNPPTASLQESDLTAVLTSITA